jgi:hypothetical protein
MNTSRPLHQTPDRRDPTVAAAVVASLGWLRSGDNEGDNEGEGRTFAEGVPAPIPYRALAHPPSHARVARLLATGNGVSAVSTVHPRLRRPPRTAAIAAFVALATALFFAPTRVLSLHDRSSSGSLPTTRRPSGVAKSPSEGMSERGTTGDSTTRGAPRSNTLHFMTQGANEMQRNQFLAAIAGVGVVAAGAAAQDAVQWRVEDGGNGHWYRVDSTQRAWTASREYAESVGGYLVTITTLGEQNFVEELPGVEEEGCAGPAIGLTQSPIGAEPGGGWSWITGEPLVFTAWGRIGSQINPDDSVGDPPNGTVDRGALWCPPWHDWDDCPDSNDYPIAAIIEWSADCNSDGIVDYGQIRSGELEDVNANGVPDCCDAGVACTCPADIDGNNEVNGIDLAIILDKWGTNGGKDYPNADIDRDGTINGADLAQVLGSWGPCQ